MVFWLTRRVSATAAGTDECAHHEDFRADYASDNAAYKAIAPKPAKIENDRARKIWWGPAGKYTRPDPPDSTEVIAARKRRDAKIVALQEAGLSNAEIGRRFGLVESSVARILRLDRLAKREANQ